MSTVRGPTVLTELDALGVMSGGAEFEELDEVEKPDEVKEPDEVNELDEVDELDGVDEVGGIDKGSTMGLKEGTRCAGTELDAALLEETSLTEPRVFAGGL